MDKQQDRGNDRDHQRIAATIRETMTARGLSQSEVARQADMSAAVLSEYLSGHYRGNRDEAGRKLLAWYEGLVGSDGLASAIDRISVFAETGIAARESSPP